MSEITIIFFFVVGLLAGRAAYFLIHDLTDFLYARKQDKYWAEAKRLTKECLTMRKHTEGECPARNMYLRYSLHDFVEDNRPARRKRK